MDIKPTHDETCKCNCGCNKPLLRKFKWLDEWETEPTSEATAGVLVLSKDNKVLLVQNCGNMWGIPKGHVLDKRYKRESALEAAKREMKEEIGHCLDIDLRKSPIKIKLKGQAPCIIYQLKKKVDEKKLELDFSKVKSDVSGIGWFCKDCIDSLTCMSSKTGYKALNNTSRLVLKQGWK
jgi:8-oxo-dGTP pyrophosphatase MutT (NUDIX family)